MIFTNIDRTISLCRCCVTLVADAMEKNRKNTRLKGADYNSPGAYFITVCTQDRRCILSRIVGTGVLDGPVRGVVEDPVVELLPYGRIVERYICQLNDFYRDVLSVERYIIMPNHVHILLFVKPNNMDDVEDGPSGTPVPTIQNSIVSRFISTFKRFCNKECGGNIWQYRSYDHVIRNQQDYDETWQYIENNPRKWFLQKQNLL